MKKSKNQTRPRIAIGNEIAEEVSRKIDKVLERLFEQNNIKQVAEINKFLNNLIKTTFNKEAKDTTDKLVEFYVEYVKAKSLGEKEAVYGNFSRYKVDLMMKDLIIQDEAEVDDDEF